jgi:phage terminase large subunit-like protein
MMTEIAFNVTRTGPSIYEQIKALATDKREALIAWMKEKQFIEFYDSWNCWARAEQLPPAWHWRVWLLMAGRGFGKTRAGAEWVHHVAQTPGARIALVGATEEEVRRVMIEGSSGILNTAPIGGKPVWEPSRGVVTFPSGAQAFVYSAANPDGLRGPEHDYAWCDELAKWAKDEATWDNLRMGMRRGKRPQIVVTTTPRNRRLLKKIKAAKSTAVTQGKTTDNVHVPQTYLAALNEDYGGTALGRQEIDGEMIEDVEGALWTRGLIEGCRVEDVPGLRRVVIGVDPPASAGGDACGIVAVGLDENQNGYVIADASVSGRSPEGWAAAVAGLAARVGADRVVAEANNGGDMVASVLRAADYGMPVRLVHASRGKCARAEPVSFLYERGRMRHAGAFPDLEDELCGMMTGGGYEGPGRSPDRADALVWAVTELMLGVRRGEPRVRVV